MVMWDGHPAYPHDMDVLPLVHPACRRGIGILPLRDSCRLEAYSTGRLEAYSTCTLRKDLVNRTPQIDFQPAAAGDFEGQRVES
jgi:hypothetical protein